MTEFEVNSKLATEVMGYTASGRMNECPLISGDQWPAGIYHNNEANSYYGFSPTTSLEQAHEVARKVVELSSPETFLIPLLQAQGESLHLEPYGSYWNIFNATPRQICEAALLAIKKAQEVEVK